MNISPQLPELHSGQAAEDLPLQAHWYRFLRQISGNGQVYRDARGDHPAFIATKLQSKVRPAVRLRAEYPTFRAPRLMAA